MKISNRIVTKFQEGGAMAPPAPAPEAAGGAPVEGGAAPAPEEAAPAQDPIMQIAEMAAQALQAQDCEASMAVCEAFLSLLQGTEGAAPAEAAPQGAPVFAKGGKLVSRI